MRHREECHVKMQAEIGLMHPQAKEIQGFLAIPELKARHRTDSSLEPERVTLLAS